MRGEAKLFLLGRFGASLVVYEYFRPCIKGQVI